MQNVIIFQQEGRLGITGLELEMKILIKNIKKIHIQFRVREKYFPVC